MTQTDLQNIKNRLKLFILNHDDVNYTTLAEFFLKANSDVPLSVRSVRRYISMVKDAESDLDADINEISEELGEELDVTSDCEPEQLFIPFPDLLTEENNVQSGLTDCISSDTRLTIENEKDKEFTNIIDIIDLKYNSTTYSFTRNTLDKVFCAFSKRGSDLTSGAIQNILNLSADEFKAITGRLGLSKDSKPYSKYSEDLLTDSKLWEEYEKNIAFLLDASDSTNADAQTKFYKKAYLANKEKDLKFKAQIDGIKELLPKIKFNIIEPELRIDGELLHVHIIIPDMHIGINQSNFNVDIIRKQLAYILSLITANVIVHVHFLGDIIHSVTGLNHQDTWKNMDPDSVGAEAIIQPYKLLVEFLASIEGLAVVNIVGGEMIASK